MAAINKIFVDMDGIVADFVQAALNIHKKKNPWEENHKHKGKYDIDQIWGMTLSEFWGPINAEEYFWHNLLKTPEADELMELFEALKLTEKYKSLQIYFASAPTPHAHCYSGKFHWIQTYYPKFYNHLILTKHKHLYAAKDALLIDDSDRNVNEFRKAGGKAILFPRHWNSSHAISITQDVMKYMKHEIKRHL